MENEDLVAEASHFHIDYESPRNSNPCERRLYFGCLGDDAVSTIYTILFFFLQNTSFPIILDAIDTRDSQREYRFYVFPSKLDHEHVCIYAFPV